MVSMLSLLLSPDGQENQIDAISSDDGVTTNYMKGLFAHVNIADYNGDGPVDV